MEAGGLSLAAVSEVRSLAASCQEKWSRYRQGPLRFIPVSSNLLGLLGACDAVEEIVNRSAIVYPPAAVEKFDSGVGRVARLLEAAKGKVDLYCARAFGESGSGVRKAWKKGGRAVRARSLAKAMEEIEEETWDAKSGMQTLQTEIFVVIYTVGRGGGQAVGGEERETVQRTRRFFKQKKGEMMLNDRFMPSRAERTPVRETERKLDEDID